MIFQSLFYRDTFAQFTFNDSFWQQYIYYAHKISFWLFLLGGIGLLKRRVFAFFLAYFATIITLGGAIYSLHPQREFSISRLLPEVLAHTILCGVLAFVQKHIRKRNAIDKQKEFAKKSK